MENLNQVSYNSLKELRKIILDESLKIYQERIARSNDVDKLFDKSTELYEQFDNEITSFLFDKYPELYSYLNYPDPIILEDCLEYSNSEFEFLKNIVEQFDIDTRLLFKEEQDNLLTLYIESKNG